MILDQQLTGVYLHNDKGKLAIVSTDAHRLYFNKTEIKTDEVFECIVPNKGIRTVIENFRKDFVFEVDANYVRFADEKTELITRKVDAKFPNYKVVLPETNMSIFIDRKILFNYLSLVYNFSNSDTRMIKVKIKKDTADFITNYDFSDDTINTIAISKTNETEYTFAVRADFLSTILSCNDSKQVEIKTMGLPTKAMIIDTHILLMPVMLNDSSY